jgi:hypothetical protein
MPQKTDVAAVRIAITSLLAILIVGLSGCSGLPMGPDSRLGRAVTGGYRGNETLAVLLPESGRFVDAARVVRAGIVAAQEADPQEKRPVLRFYDSAVGSVAAIVQQAAADGASLVIGPLQKPAVEKLVGLSALPIPVLALNQVPGGGKSPQNLYQFALSPEDEAAEVAYKAWNGGHRRALMLYPQDDWGGRISRAFLQTWKGLGGAMTVIQAYNPAATDFSTVAAELSERAAGADFVFLVATAKDAPQIWPHVRNRLGTRVAGYSTSHIFRGRFDPKSDRALVGLHFVEIPWLIEPAQGDPVSAKGLYDKLPQLYAMGVDAYRLGSRLEWLSANPQARVQGKTGILSLDGRRRIRRELILVRIDATGPVKTTAIDRGGWNFFEQVASFHESGPRLNTAGFPRLAQLDH